MEAAHPGGAVGGSGDNFHQRVVGAALVPDQVFPALGGPGHQEALCVVSGGGEGPARQGVLPVAQGGHQVPLRQALRNRLDSQGLLPLLAEELDYGVVHIVFQV